jgi:DNA-directed RNA polymerase sigma subunit (sigma70/sigma32)
MILRPDPGLDASLHHFLNLARRYPALDHGEERTLLARLREGDPEAVDHLVHAHLRYVVDLAVLHEDQWRHLPLRDLLAEGAAALEMAVRRFQARRHGPFRLHVIAAIEHAMATAGSLTRTPGHRPRTPAPRLRRTPAPASGRRAAAAASGSPAAGSP